MTTVTVSSTPDPIWYKTQRVLRTVVAVGIPSFLGLAVIFPSVVDALGLPLKSPVELALVAAAGVITAIAAAITRVMAIPGVNNGLTRIGLGSVPKSAVQQQIDPAVLDAALAIAAKQPTA